MEKFEIKDGCLLKYNGEEENVVIPESVTSIGVGAFRNCGSIKSVIIPNSVTNICNGAFLGCENLKNTPEIES